MVHAQWAKDQEVGFDLFHIIGLSQDRGTHELRELLTRFNVPFRFHPADSEQGRHLLENKGLDTAWLPVMIRHDGYTMIGPAPAQIIAAVGRSISSDVDKCDVVIVGAGPAGGPVIYSAADARTVLSRYRTLVAGAPDELSTVVSLLSIPPVPFVPPDSHGKAAIAVVVCWSWSNPRGRGRHRAIPVVGTADRRRDRPDALHRPADDVRLIVAKATLTYWRSGFLPELSDGAVDTLLDRAWPNGPTEIHLHHLGGAVARYGDDHAAYRNREAAFASNLLARWADPAEDRDCRAWARNAHEAMERFGTGGCTSTSCRPRRRSRCAPRSAPTPTPGWSHSRTATTGQPVPAQPRHPSPRLNGPRLNKEAPEMGVINREDIPVAIKDNNVEVRLSKAGDMTVSFIRLQKGTDLGPALAGLPDDLCPCPHWGYMFKGRLTMKTRNGDEVYEAGQAFYWPPGHAPAALEDCEYMDFSPTQEFAAVIRHLTSGG